MLFKRAYVLPTDATSRRSRGVCISSVVQPSPIISGVNPADSEISRNIPSSTLACMIAGVSRRPSRAAQSCTNRSNLDSGSYSHTGVWFCSRNGIINASPIARTWCFSSSYPCPELLRMESFTLHPSSERFATARFRESSALVPSSAAFRQPAGSSRSSCKNRITSFFSGISILDDMPA